MISLWNFSWVKGHQDQGEGKVCVLTTLSRALWEAVAEPRTVGPQQSMTLAWLWALLHCLPLRDRHEQPSPSRMHPLGYEGGTLSQQPQQRMGEHLSQGSTGPWAN